MDSIFSIDHLTSALNIGVVSIALALAGECVRVRGVEDILASWNHFIIK